MLSVMIIDDEDYIREGLKKIIDWNKYGFYICGEANNGLRGITQICILKPDLVIVDIKMPKMDGLEMIGELRKKEMLCEFIVLSAYSEFKYAQAAIELDIDSYVLKPIEQPILAEKISKVHDKILNKKQTKLNIDLNISFSREKIFQSIILNQIDAQILEKNYLLYRFDFPWNSYRIALIEIEGERMETISLKTNVKRLIETVMTENKMGFVFDIENYVGIILNDTRLSSNSRIIYELPQRIKGVCQADATILLGSSVVNIKDISLSYRHACNLSNRKFILGYKRVISDENKDEENINNSVDAHSRYSVEHTANTLCQAIEAENMGQINNILEGLLQEFMLEVYNEDIIKVNYSNIYSATINKLASVNPGMKEKLGINQGILSEICKKPSLQELHGYMKYILTEISEDLKAQRPEDPISKVIEYIERNYYQDIKLETLAALFNYNSDYLGKKIKLKTGKHFNAYLDSIRFDKAKQFLTEGYKVYQVAQKIGFRDINYFYKKFKLYEGVSPSDYKCGVINKSL